MSDRVSVGPQDEAGLTEDLRPAVMGVDLDAIAQNYQEAVRRAGPGRRVIASIKANAYGHGVLEVARKLQHQNVFACWTGHVPEAIAMRRAGITSRIIMFGGYLPASIPTLLRYNLIPTIYDGVGLDAAISAARAGPVPIYVKVDAGLGRLGVSLTSARAFIRRVASDSRLRLEGVYTHLSFKDAQGEAWALDCSKCFLALLSDLRDDGIDPPVTQLWGSSGLLANLPDATNAVCLGHVLYGLSPVLPELAPLDGFRPACHEIGGRLIQVAQHMPGDPMTFLGVYRSAAAMRTGILALGLGEGMRRPIAGAGPKVLVGGQRVPLVGTSLEHSIVDLSAVAGARVGDYVVLLGRQGNQEITLQDWADWFGCSPLEVVMSFGGRIRAQYLAATEGLRGDRV
jgi:alanine racemase